MTEKTEIKDVTGEVIKALSFFKSNSKHIYTAFIYDNVLFIEFKNPVYLGDCGIVTILKTFNMTNIKSISVDGDLKRTLITFS